MVVQHDFWPLRKVSLFDAGEEGLAIYLETQQTLETGAPKKFGCLVTEDQGVQLLRELASALDKKYPNTRH